MLIMQQDTKRCDGKKSETHKIDTLLSHGLNPSWDTDHHNLAKSKTNISHKVPPGSDDQSYQMWSQKVQRFRRYEMHKHS